MIDTESITPITGDLQETIHIECLASGQPRPYADHRRVMRVHFIHHNVYKNESTPNNYPDDQDRQIARAISVIGYGHLSFGYPKDVWTESTWIDSAKIVAPGVVEIVKIDKFFD